MTQDLTYWGPASIALALVLGFAVALWANDVNPNSGQLMLPISQSGPSFG